MDAPPIEPPSVEPDDPGPGDPRPPDAAPPRQRRLTRRSDERLLGGVAGGIAEYVGADVVLVRLGFVVTAFFGGLGVIAYVLGWIVLPLAPPTTARRTDRKQLLGYGLVALGLITIGGRVGWSFKADGAFWALTLIGLGAAVLWLRTRDVASEPPGGPAAPDTPPRPATPSTVPISETRPEAPPVAPPPRSYLGALTWSSLLVLSGGAWVIDASGAADVDLGVVFALALALVGAALVTSAWIGRARGLIALGIPLVLIVGAFSVIEVPLDGGIGGPTYQPRTLASVDREYRLGIGDLSVDLRDVDFSGARRRVHAQLGIGQLNVTVPTDVRVVFDGRVRLGSITAFGHQRDVCCPTHVHFVRAGAVGAGTVIVDADVGAGHIEITRRGETLRATS